MSEVTEQAMRLLWAVAETQREHNPAVADEVHRMIIRERRFQEAERTNPQTIGEAVGRWMGGDDA